MYFAVLRQLTSMARNHVSFDGFSYNDSFAMFLHYLVIEYCCWTCTLCKSDNLFQENGVSSQSLIIRRMKTLEQETSG